MQLIQNLYNITLIWIKPGSKPGSIPDQTRHCGLVVSAPAWDGTGCEFDSWQCRIYIPCSLSLRLLGSLRGALGTNGLTQKLCKKNGSNPDQNRIKPGSIPDQTRIKPGSNPDQTRIKPGSNPDKYNKSTYSIVDVD